MVDTLLLLCIIGYVIVAILTIMGFIYYTAKKEGTVDLINEDSYIFAAGIFWPMTLIIGIIYTFCHLNYVFFSWFAKCFEKEDKDDEERSKN